MYVEQVNDQFKRGNIGMVQKGGRQDRNGWMHVAMVMTFEP